MSVKLGRKYQRLIVMIRVVDNNFELFWAEMIVENGGFYADEKRHFPCSK